MKLPDIANHHTAHLILHSVGLAIVLLLNGCATAPPLRGHADLLNFITDGKTTKGEVLNSLGQPSGQFESEKILSYRWATSQETTVITRLNAKSRCAAIGL